MYENVFHLSFAHGKFLISEHLALCRVYMTLWFLYLFHSASSISEYISKDALIYGTAMHPDKLYTRRNGVFDFSMTIYIN